MSIEVDKATNWRAALRHYAELLELPGGQRVAALEQAKLPAAVDAHVRELLSAGDSTSVLDADVQVLAEPVALNDLGGQIIGCWRLVREIGRGGMAVVYLAERQGAPFEQSAAIKLLPRGTIGHEHFTREQQVLARLEHPNIARLLDGGVASDGTPWLAMEFVDGERIDDFCRNLDPRRVVGCLQQVIEAVAYAHRHLVIHRDIKPGNILVDKDGRVRLLDFGIARLISEDGGGPATRLLTPGYAAPEQFDGGAISTATDVFGLGGVLHRLLCGEPPRNREGEWSSAMSGADVDADLKNIVRMALREEPEARYDTARALGTDLQRWLDSLPVQATQGSRRYRLRKWLRRHRTGVAATALVLIASLAGMAGIIWQARQTETQARTVEAQNAFLRDLLASPQSVARGRQVQVVEVLGDAISKLDSSFPVPSMARAELFATMGRSMVQLDEAGKGAVLWQHAVDDLDALGGAPPTLDIIYRLGLAEALTFARDEAQARLILERIESIAASKLGPAHPLHALIAMRSWLAWENEDPARAGKEFEHALELAPAIAWTPASKAEFGCLKMQGLLTQGRYQDAITAAGEFLAWVPATIGEKHSDTLCVYQQFASALGASGHLARAEATAREAERIAASWLGENDRTVYTLRHTLANLIQEQGRFDEAIGIFQELIDSFDRFIGLNATDRILARQGVAVSYLESGRYAEAEPVLRQVIGELIEENGEQHLLTLIQQINLAELLVFDGRSEQALELARTTWQRLEQSAGPEHPVTLVAKSKLGGALASLGRSKEALALLDGLDVRLAEFFGSDDTNVASARVWLAQALLDSGRSEDALPLLETALAWRLDYYGKEHPLTRNAQSLLDRARAKR